VSCLATNAAPPQVCCHRIWRSTEAFWAATRAIIPFAISMVVTAAFFRSSRQSRSATAIDPAVEDVRAATRRQRDDDALRRLALLEGVAERAVNFSRGLVVFRCS
jgi:hypothetical protein